MGMMINRRRVCGGKSLPYDAEIEYLESSGTQWIDTGIVPTVDLNTIVKHKINRIVTKTGVFGCFGSTSYYYLYVSSEGYRQGGIGGSYTNFGNGHFETTNIHEFRLLYPNIYYDNTIIYTSNSDNFKTDATIALYTIKRENGTIYSILPQKLYSVIMKKGNTLILDLIPVRVGQVGYMYDRVSGQLFGNSGTGSFILGPDKGSAVRITQQQQHEMYGE